jgi:multiple sugar transport system ATP-binding protein
VAGFIGSPKMNLLNGKNAASFNCETVGVRPEHLDIVETGGQWTGTVIHTEKLGADSFLYLDVGMDEPMTVREDGTTKYNTGDTISVKAEDGKIHRFGKDGRPVAA